MNLSEINIDCILFSSLILQKQLTMSLEKNLDSPMSCLSPSNCLIGAEPYKEKRDNPIPLNSSIIINKSTDITNNISQ